MKPRLVNWILGTLLALIFVGCGDTGITPEALQELKRSDKVFGFVAQVSLRPEYQSSAPIIVKWTSSPKLSVFGGDSRDEEFVAEAVLELNEILKPARFSIEMLPADSPKATLKVFFAPVSDFERISKEHGMNYVVGNPGYLSYWTHGMGGIHKAVVMIDRKASKKFKKHLIREEITQSLGPANDSDYSRSSIFYEKKGISGEATKFSSLDKKLIRFFYQYLKPGYGERKLAQVYLQHWEV